MGNHRTVKLLEPINVAVTIPNGIPAGGTTGQVLKKASNADYDTEWGTGGGGVDFEASRTYTGAVIGASSSLTSSIAALDTAIDTKEMLSAGVYTQPTISNTAGTITVGAGIYAIYSSPDFTGSIKKYTVAGGDFVLTDETYNYLVCKYNGGSPIVTVITNLDEITDSDVVPIYSIFRTGTFIHTTDWDHFAKGLTNKINRYIRRTKRFTIESGLSLSSSGTRQINTTSGIVWAAGANSINVGAAVQGTNTTFFCYHSAGAWVRDTATASYPNTQYDNGTDLVALGASRYAVIWVYRGVETNNHIYYTLGTGNFTLSQAQASLEPAKPAIISSHTVLVGRIIIQNGSNTPTQIDNVSNTAFATEGVQSHTDLINRDALDQHTIGATTGLEPLVTETRTNLTATNGATSTIDLSLGRTFKIDASALAAGNSFTVALSNVPAGTVVTSAALLLKTGANIPTVTWPTGVTAPTLAANKTLWGTLATEDNGTTWRWFKAGEF